MIALSFIGVHGKISCIFLLHVNHSKPNIIYDGEVQSYESTDPEFRPRFPYGGPYLRTSQMYDGDLFP